jgi:hypothetical protein
VKLARSTYAFVGVCGFARRRGSGPSELDQVGATYGRPRTNLDDLPGICRRLPCEAGAVVVGDARRPRRGPLAIDPIEHLDVAESFYGSGNLVNVYRQFVLPTTQCR